MDTQNDNKFEQFCIVELFGHNKIAGKVTEQVIGGQSFIRVDVPKTSKRDGFTRFFGNGAIYSITPVSEEIANLAAEQIWTEPVQVYISYQRQLEKDDSDWEGED